MDRDLKNPGPTAAGKPIAESPTPAVILWLIIQAMAIAISSFRVSLWIHSPDATEYIALTILLAMQILASALLSPRLCHDYSTTLVAIATAWPFIVAADFLSTAPVSSVTWVGAYMTVWLAAIAILQSSLNTKGRMMASGLLGSWAVAGPVFLLFMANERSNGSLPVLSGAMRAATGPLLNGLPITVAGTDHSLWIWAPAAVVAVVGGGTKWRKSIVIKHRAVGLQTAS